MDQPTAMHMVRIESRHTDKHGRERQYESRLLRRTWREGGTVRNQTPSGQKTGTCAPEPTQVRG